MDEIEGVRSRGYLPHIDAGTSTQFVTFRTADSMPQDVYRRILRDSMNAPEGKRSSEQYRLIEAQLDSCRGECLLKSPIAQHVLISALLKLNSDGNRIHSFVVLPNHVHFVVSPANGTSLSSILQRLKGSTSRLIHERMGRSGRLWQPESFDRLIRSQEHLEKVNHYVEWNPVKAKLATDPKYYGPSSANPVILEKLLLNLPVNSQAEACGPGAD